MEIFELLRTLAQTSLAALAIAAGTVVVLGLVVGAIAFTADSVASRRANQG